MIQTEKNKHYAVYVGVNLKVKYTLFTPGPVDVPDTVLQSTAHPILYHRDATFSEVLKTTQEGLNTILGSSGRTFILTSSGTVQL